MCIAGLLCAVCDAPCTCKQAVGPEHEPSPDDLGSSGGLTTLAGQGEGEGAGEGAGKEERAGKEEEAAGEAAGEAAASDAAANGRKARASLLTQG